LGELAVSVTAGPSGQAADRKTIERQPRRLGVSARGFDIDVVFEHFKRQAGACGFLATLRQIRLGTQGTVSDGGFPDGYTQAQIFIAELFLLGATMKDSKLILSAAFAVSAMLGIGAASAADLPMKSMPYAAPVPVFSWTGFYIGGNVGAGVLLDQGVLALGLSADRHGVGALAGGQIGYNWQIGMFVLGIEGEGFWSGMKSTQNQFIGNPSFLVATYTARNKWDYDIAGRFGIAVDHALIYGKAGWVAGGFDWNASQISSTNFNCGTFCSTNQGGLTLNGLLVGIGLEYAFTNNWTAKFEYDYLGFGAQNGTFTNSCLTCTPFTFTHSVSAEKHIFKVGINYLFNVGKGPIVAR
jgi:outer membrane immunogenic protein